MMGIATPVAGNPRDAAGPAPRTHAGSRLFRESAALHASLYAFIAFKLVAGFLVARFLGPGLYGVRTALGLAVDYEPYAQLGTYEAMLKEVPFHRARGDDAAADRVLSTVFGANLIAVSALAALLWISASLVRLAGAPLLLAAFLFFLGAYSIVSRIRAFYATWMTAEKYTYLLSELRTLHGFLTAALSVGLVVPWGLPGLFAGIFIATLLSLAWTVYRVQWVPRPVLDWTLAWRLVRAGSPILLIGLLFLLFRSVDKILILALLSNDMLGYFAVALITSAVAFDAVGDLLRVMFFPRLMGAMAQPDGRAVVRGHLLDLTLLVGAFTPLLVGTLFLAIHLPIVHLAPDFAPAIPVARTLVVGQFFFALGIVPMLVCIAIDRQRVVLLFIGGAILLNAVLNLALISAGHGITAVAVGTGISYAVFGLALLTFTSRALAADGRMIAPIVLRVLTLFVVSLLLLGLLIRWQPVAPPTLATDIAITMGRISVFVALYTALLCTMRSHPAFVHLAAHLPGRGSAAATSPPYAEDAR